MAFKNLTALLCLCGIMAGCSTDQISEINNNNNNPEQPIKKNTISGTVVFDGVEAEQPTTRIGLVELPTGGVKYKYGDGEQLRMYTLFVQTIPSTDGSQPTVVKAVSDQDYITVHTDADGKVTGTFDLTVPSGIDLSKGLNTVQVTGAIGVRSIDEDGNAVVKWYGKNTVRAAGDENGSDDPSKETDQEGGEIYNEYEIDGENGYSVPMYFPLTTINSGGKLNVTFRNYGSLLKVDVTSKLYDPYFPREVDIISKAFTSEGTMSLLENEAVDIDGTSVEQPKWTASQTESDVRRYPVNINTANNNEGKLATIYLWMKPNTDEAKQNFYLAFQEELSDFDIQSVGLQTIYRKKWKFRENKVYDIPVELTSDLIITEYYRTSDTGYGNIWEFYNPTTDPIDLRKYYMLMAYCKEPDKYLWCRLWPSRDDITPSNTPILATSGAKYDPVYRFNVRGTSTLFKDWSWLPTKDDRDPMLQPGQILIIGANDQLNAQVVPFRLSDPIAKGKVKVLCYLSKQGSFTDESRYTPEGPRMFQARKVSNVNAFNTSNDDSSLGYNTWHAIARRDDWQDNPIPTLDDIVDNFGRRKVLNAKGEINYQQANNRSYARKPSRNFARKYTVPETLDSYSSWLHRDGRIRDFGWRFAAYWTPKNTQKQGDGLVYKWVRIANLGGTAVNLYACPKWWNEETRH